MKHHFFPMLVIISLFSRFALADELPLIVIAHSSVSVNSLNIDDVKDIYLLHNRQWSDSTPIVVINRPSGSEIRNRFEQKILGTAAKKYALHIERLHYQGVTLPVIQESTQAVIAFVQNVPGAIAYIEGLPNHSQVKVLMELK
jgi:ABC-type phosphate transport system substrate-binding protein